MSFRLTLETGYSPESCSRVHINYMNLAVHSCPHLPNIHLGHHQMVLLVHRLVFVYIDDYCGAEANSEDAWRSYRGLTELLMSLGLYLSYEKCYSPRTTLVWIGVEFNTLNMTMQIDPKKVAEVHALVCSWL